MGLKYIPKTLDQALEWKSKFEKTFRWREDANEVMAMAMLNQVLYPIPGPLKGFVAQVFVSIVDWDSKFMHMCSGNICLQSLQLYISAVSRLTPVSFSIADKRRTRKARAFSLDSRDRV